MTSVLAAGMLVVAGGVVIRIMWILAD